MVYLNGLNPEQLEAVTKTEGYIRVIAGAGSGKTKTLTSRYIYLVDQLGISTANILCVTFTNKAAAEMKKRIRLQLPDQDLGRITTFHGFCVGLLKEDCHVVRYPRPGPDGPGGRGPYRMAERGPGICKDSDRRSGKAAGTVPGGHDPEG